MTQNRPLVGIAIVAMATLFFAVSDVLTKHLTGLYPVSMVIAMRYLVSMAILLVFVLPRVGARLWRTERVWLVLSRGLVLTAASFTMGHALRLMPVGETITIMYLSPIAVMILAIPLLGERVGPLSWALAGLGFAGVLLIMRPGAGLDPVGLMFALANAACATAFHLLTRVLSRSEDSITLLFWVTLSGSVAFGVLAVPTLAGPLPGLRDLSFMALLGLSATFGHFFFSLAYREAPASFLAPVNYMHLVWAGVLGWVVFSHAPGLLSLIGMAMVAASGVLIALRGHFVARATRRMPAQVPQG